MVDAEPHLIAGGCEEWLASEHGAPLVALESPRRSAIGRLLGFLAVQASVSQDGGWS
jgi:hypothetical protein